MNIILIGAQGSGKGTQAQMLAQSLGVRHIASGNMFREAYVQGTELGIKARTFIDRGELVPDDITLTMVLSRIEEPESDGGVLLDGFPRTLAQAEALDEDLKKIRRVIDTVVYLNVPRNVLHIRISGRYICEAHQHAYNIYTNPPQVPGICDIDGSKLFQRSDDTDEAAQKRLDTFFQETIHLIEYYRQQGKLVEVNGDQSIEQVQSDLVIAIKAHKQ